MTTITSIQLGGDDFLDDYVTVMPFGAHAYAQKHKRDKHNKHRDMQKKNTQDQKELFTIQDQHAIQEVEGVY